MNQPIGFAKPCLILLASEPADIQPLLDSVKVAKVECLQFAARNAYGGLRTAGTGAKGCEGPLYLPAIGLVLIPHHNKARSRIQIAPQLIRHLLLEILSSLKHNEARMNLTPRWNQLGKYLF
jgi:hypothetical protein